jgi:DNA-binding MarR family transcriptional regulator
MSLKDELGFLNSINSDKHETLMSIVVTAHMLEREGDRLLEKFGLSVSQFNILMLLRYQADAAGPDQQSLGRMLVVNRSNITGLVDRLERAGFVERAGEKLDRRVKRVRLTAKGRKNLEAAEAAYMKHIDMLLASTSLRERGDLLGALSKIRAGLRKKN